MEINGKKILQKTIQEEIKAPSKIGNFRGVKYLRAKNDENNKKIEGEEILSMNPNNNKLAAQKAPLRNSTNCQQIFPVNYEKASNHGLPVYKAHDTVIEIRGLEPSVSKRVERDNRCKSAPRSQVPHQKTRDQATQSGIPWEGSEKNNETQSDFFQNECLKADKANLTLNNLCWSKMNHQSDTESHQSNNSATTVPHDKEGNLPSESSEGILNAPKIYLNTETPMFQNFYKINSKTQENSECYNRIRSLSRSRPTTCQTSFLIEGGSFYNEILGNEIVGSQDTGNMKKSLLSKKSLTYSLKLGNWLMGEAAVKAAGEMRNRIFSKQRQIRIKMNSMSEQLKGAETHAKPGMSCMYQLQSQNQSLIIRNSEKSPKSSTRSSFQKYTQDKYLPKI